MSRRSSFGYSSYGSRSYRSGGYRGRRNRHNKAKTVIIILLVILILAAAAFGVWYFFLREKPADTKSQEAPATESSAASVVSEASAVKEPSKSESSKEESSKEPDIEGYHDGNVFMYDRQGYEMFYGTDESAAKYAAAVSEIKKLVGSKVNVYNMVVPNHAAFGLPKKYLDTMNDEKANIETIYKSYSEDVIPVSVYAAEEKHKAEYIYFKTDHNWTGLGAYYAYQELCKAMKTNAVDINSLTKGNITGFKGSLFVATKTEEKPDGNKELSANPDTVVYYNMPGVESCILMENGKTQEQEVSLIAGFAEGSNAYSAFIWGNNPYMKVKTTQKTGKKLCIIKDSYGCAIAPFTVANFDEIYIVDPSYYDGNVIDYIKKNKFTDVLVINSVMNANTEFRIKDIQSVIK